MRREEWRITDMLPTVCDHHMRFATQRKRCPVCHVGAHTKLHTQIIDSPMVSPALWRHQLWRYPNWFSSRAWSTYLLMWMSPSKLCQTRIQFSSHDRHTLCLRMREWMKPRSLAIAAWRVSSTLRAFEPFEREWRMIKAVLLTTPPFIIRSRFVSLQQETLM